MFDLRENLLHRFKAKVKKEGDFLFFEGDFEAILLDTNNDWDSYFDIFINPNVVKDDGFCEGRGGDRH